MYPKLKRPKLPSFIPYILGIFVMIILMMIIFWGRVGAEEVDLSIIATIESDNNPKAVSPCGAIGTYQIMPCVLQEYNNAHQGNWAGQNHPLTQIDLFYHDTNYAVAYWYMNKQIPHYLAWYGLDDTIDARLACYNAEIGVYLKYKQGKRKLSDETVRYIKKYHKLAKAK